MQQTNAVTAAAITMINNDMNNGIFWTPLQKNSSGHSVTCGEIVGVDTSNECRQVSVSVELEVVTDGIMVDSDNGCIVAETVAP